MTPKERMLRAYRGLETDRIPVAPEFWNYIGAKRLIGNYPDEHDTLRPYEAYVYYYEDVKE